MPQVRFLSEVVSVEVEAGTTLLAAAEKAGVELFRGLWPTLRCGSFALGPFGAFGACNRCKVWVTPLSPDAVNPRTKKEGGAFRWNGALPATGNQRLACQVRVQGDVDVRTRILGPAIPEVAAVGAPALIDSWAAFPHAPKSTEPLAAPATATVATAPAAATAPATPATPAAAVTPAAQGATT